VRVQFYKFEADALSAAFEATRRRSYAEVHSGRVLLIGRARVMADLSRVSGIEAGVLQGLVDGDDVNVAPEHLQRFLQWHGLTLVTLADEARALREKHLRARGVRR
jgi:hypothetical protein